MSTVRLCGPECSVPHLPHLAPEPDWIGDYPVMHGESERPVPGSGTPYGAYRGLPDAYCLCGHPDYLTCPEAWGDGSVWGMTITAEDGEP